MVPSDTICRMEPKQVFQEPLELPRSAGAALAAELIASLDGEADADAELLWAQEFRKRVEEIESGTVRAVPWSLARKRILIAAGRDPNS